MKKYIFELINKIINLKTIIMEVLCALLLMGNLTFLPAFFTFGTYDSDRKELEMFPWFYNAVSLFLHWVLFLLSEYKYPNASGLHVLIVFGGMFQVLILSFYIFLCYIEILNINSKALKVFIFISCLVVSVFSTCFGKIICGQSNLILIVPILTLVSLPIIVNLATRNYNWKLPKKWHTWIVNHNPGKSFEVVVSSQAAELLWYKFDKEDQSFLKVLELKKRKYNKEELTEQMAFLKRKYQNNNHRLMAIESAFEYLVKRINF